MSRFACAVIKSGKRQDRSFKKVPKGKLYDKLRKVSPMEEKYTNIWWTLKKKEHERIVKRKEEDKNREDKLWIWKNLDELFKQNRKSGE